LGLVRDKELTQGIYIVIKTLLLDMIKDQEIEKILVDFISQTFMNALNQPINEKYIKDKIVELVTSESVMDSITESLKVVATRDDIKKVLGDSAIESISLAVKDKYPRIGKYL